MRITFSRRPDPVGGPTRNGTFTHVMDTASDADVPSPGRRTYAEQLQDTLAYAVANIPWYRERADAYLGPMDTLEDLARRPIIDRSMVMADQRAFAGSDEWPSAISYSSSTTGGIGQPRWRTSAEQQAIVDHLGPPADRDGVTLVIHPFDQGPPLLPPGAVNRVYVGMFVPWHFDLIHQMLAEGWSSPTGRVPVTTVDCFSPGLRILTDWFDQRGIDPASFGVRHLLGYGSIQPRPWRRRLEAAWGAGYTDMYGLSEVTLSDAAECPLCHAFHFPLPIVPEVVDPVNRVPIDRGTGVLLLTELHPFAQLQLLMRYWTDDLVELARPCPLGGFGIFLRGRRSMSAVVERPDGPPLVVGALQVGELCAELPDVALGPIPWAPWAHDVGGPRFSLTSSVAGAPEVRVRVELRYQPALHPTRAAAVRDELLRSMRDEITDLAGAVDAGHLHLTVDAVGPGGLDEAVKV